MIFCFLYKFSWGYANYINYGYYIKITKKKNHVNLDKIQFIRAGVLIDV